MHVNQSYTDAVTALFAFEKQAISPTRSSLAYSDSKHSAMSIFLFGKSSCPACSHMKRLFSSESSSIPPSRSILLTSPLYNSSSQSTTAPLSWIPIKQRRKSMLALGLKPKEKEGHNPWGKWSGYAIARIVLTQVDRMVRSPKRMCIVTRQTLPSGVCNISWEYSSWHQRKLFSSTFDRRTSLPPLRRGRASNCYRMLSRRPAPLKREKECMSCAEKKRLII